MKLGPLPLIAVAVAAAVGLVLFRGRGAATGGAGGFGPVGSGSSASGAMPRSLGNPLDNIGAFAAGASGLTGPTVPAAAAVTPMPSPMPTPMPWTAAEPGPADTSNVFGAQSGLVPATTAAPPVTIAAGDALPATSTQSFVVAQTAAPPVSPILDNPYSAPYTPPPPPQPTNIIQQLLGAAPLSPAGQQALGVSPMTPSQQQALGVAPLSPAGQAALGLATVNPSTIQGPITLAPNGSINSLSTPTQPTDYSNAQRAADLGWNTSADLLPPDTVTQNQAPGRPF